MKLSLNWLKEFVEIEGITPQDLALKITMSTAELEGVEAYDGQLGGILTCRILEVKKHPRADRLTLVTIDTGEKTEQVVCGAPNVAAGQVVPLAPPGSVVGEDMKVKKTRIRGSESFGMLCSAFELGLGADHSGIMELDQNLVLGKSLSHVLNLEDWIFEIDNKSITHRPDLWGHYGFAREIAAILEAPLKPYPAPPLSQTEGDEKGVSVHIEAPDLCPRYMALVMDGFRIEEAPLWMQSRLKSVDVRPINNVVDLTNYIMLEIGQPMHAFDYQKIQGPEIRVRRAEDGETLVTLDGVERELDSNTLVIADQNRAVALAGIMGGGNTEVENKTTKILLESASFAPHNVRKSGARLGLRTEAVARFEKSLDPQFASLGLQRFAHLFPQVAQGAKITGGLSDAGQWQKPPIVISLSFDKLNRRLGKPLPRETVEGILQRLEFQLESSGDSIQATVPSFRATKDVTIEEDLVEEVGRMYGYDNIEPQDPLVQCTPPPEDEERCLERHAKEILAHGLGFREVSNYSFSDEDILLALIAQKDEFCTLRNPIAANMKRLRRSLVPGLLALIPKNQMLFPQFRLFEVGKIYLPEKTPEGDLPDERKMIGGLTFSRRPEEVLFYHAKGAVEILLRRLHVKNVDFQPWEGECASWIHPARCCRVMIGDKEAGLVSQIHPQAAAALEIEGEASVFHLDFALLRMGVKRTYAFKPLPKFPGVYQDISVVVDEGIPVKSIHEVISGSDSKLISRVELFDIYRGGSIPKRKKSLSFRVTYQSSKKTLTDAEVARIHDRIVENLSKMGGALRSL